MKTKRLKSIAGVLATLLAISMLMSACGKNGQEQLESFGSGPVETTQSETPQTEPSETVAPGSGAVETKTPDEEETSQPREGKEAPIEIDGREDLPYAVLENEGCDIKLQEIVKDDDTGEVYLTFAVENNNSEYDIQVESDYIADGGFLAPGSINEYITFGTSTETYVQVTDGLDIAADAPHTRITVPLRVTQLTPDEDVIIFDRVLEIYPEGKEKASEYIPDVSSGTVVIDDNGCKVVFCGFERSEYYGGWAMRLYCENNTDTTLLFRNTKATVNGGTSLDPHWGIVIEPGLRTFGEAVWLDIEASVAGLEVVSEADVDLQVINIDAEDTPEIASGNVSAKMGNRN